MNKKIFAGVTALILTMSGVLCGCSPENNTDSDESSASSSSKSDSVSADNEKEESSASDVSLKDKIYTDYLSQQKLCTISKNFKILEAGTARDNPNGLAGAVKHDFDGDKIDELVTFTFEKNSTNGEDIRVDLLKVSDGSLNVVDSKYLTELADLSSQPKDNTIYFDWTATTNLISSEYNGKLYFGCLFSEACDDFNKGSVYFGGFGVFTIENDTITKQSIGYTEVALDCNVFAKLLPPSIRDTADLEGLVDAENHITLYSGFDGKETGLYTSDDEAVSAMLNEFGLDIQSKYDDENSQHSDADPDYHWVSKNDSTIKTIICTEYLMSYHSDNSFMNGYDDYYAGIKLILDSDLETLLDNDNLFTEPFADELALYEDILRYPYYYHEIWDTYLQLDKQLSDPIGINYCIADVNRDDKYEMVITGYADSDQLPLHCSVILPDSTTIEIAGQGETKFLDNGIVSVTEVGGAMSPVHYYDINSNTSWTANDVRQEDMEYIRVIGQDNSDTRLEGAEAEKKEQELSSGNVLLLNEIYYNIYSNNFSELTVVEDISEITCTWQKAYLSAIDEFKEISNAPYGTEYEYALLYIDDNDTPELYILDKPTGISGLYTYHNGDAILISQAGSERANAFYGYIENKSVFVTYNSGGMYYWGYEIKQLSNGSAAITETVICEDEVYSINDAEVTEKEFEDKLAEYSNQFAEITYSSEDKIKRTLNGIAETWQNAYIEKIDESSGESSEFTDVALLYIDDDDIPEIYIQNYSYKRDAGFIYSYKNGEAYEMGRICGLRMEIGGYKEKGNMYYSDFSADVGRIEGHEFYQVENGYGVFMTCLSYDQVEDQYYIDDKEVNKETYNQKFEELKQGMDSTPEILSYDEILKKLNTNS